jgi:hypothetical protein
MEANQEAAGLPNAWYLFSSLTKDVLHFNGGVLLSVENLSPNSGFHIGCYAGQ